MFKHPAKTDKAEKQEGAAGDFSRVDHLMEVNEKMLTAHDKSTSKAEKESAIQSLMKILELEDDGSESDSDELTERMNTPELDRDDCSSSSESDCISTLQHTSLLHRIALTPGVYSEAELDAICVKWLASGHSIDIKCTLPADHGLDAEFLPGGTPLHFCFGSREPNIVFAKILVKHGASLDETVDPAICRRTNAIFEKVTAPLKPLQVFQRHIDFVYENMKQHFGHKYSQIFTNESHKLLRVELERLSLILQNLERDLDEIVQNRKHSVSTIKL